MAKPDKTTKILEDGLHYKSKTSGSPFQASTSSGQATMSCFLCGKHRIRALMVNRKFIGKSHAVCSPSCKAMDETSK